MESYRPILIAISPLVAMFLGAVVLWWQYSLPPSVRVGGVVWSTLGKATGWVLLVLGIFAFVFVMTNIACLIALPATAVVLVSIATQYRMGERASLLWALTVAAERGIPLQAAARAFAEERNDLIGLRARYLAEYLDAGVPLAMALQRTHYGIPAAALLAADLGQQTGMLGPALRQVVTQLDEFDATFRSILEKLFYLAVLLVFNLTVITFLMLKIIPVFQHMLSEFEMQLPAATQRLIAISDGVASLGPVLVLPLLLCFALLVWFFLQYMGLVPKRVPGFGWLWWHDDCAWVMRWLANGVRQNRPLAEVVRLLACYFPQARMRNRLNVAAGRIDQGANWCECLQQAGVIRQAETAVFRSAERVGNLAWALEEMADSTMRRAANRVRAFVNIAFPAVVVMFGLVVFFVESSILLPLIKLMQGLS